MKHTFDYTPPHKDDYPHRAYVLIDDLFDVLITRTEKGIFIDVYPQYGSYCIATLRVSDQQVRS